MVTQLWEQDLPDDHRALLKMVRERLHDPFEQRALDDLSYAELGVRYADLLLMEFVRIPKGTAVVPCRWCQKPLCWIPNRWGVKSPITDKLYLEPLSVTAEDCYAPTADSAGSGIPHHGDCPRSMYRTMHRLAADRVAAVEARDGDDDEA